MLYKIQMFYKILKMYQKFYDDQCRYEEPRGQLPRGRKFFEGETEPNRLKNYKFVTLEPSIFIKMCVFSSKSY